MDDTRALGADLRSLRKSRGLTLEALSAELGKSVGWLSQVERDLSALASDDLTALARVLRVPVTLFAAPETADSEEGRIVRRDRRRAIGERVPGLFEELLSPDLTDDYEVVHSTFQPGSESREVRRATTELGYVVSGRLDLWLGDERFTVGEGDSFRIRDEALRWANPYDAPAIAVWVISPPVY